MSSRILVFGDSIARGYWDREGGWETRLRKLLVARSLQNLSDAKLYWITYNLGVSGDTTEDLLQRFEFETKQRSKEKEKTMFIFQIGSNDSQFYNNKKTFHVTPEKFEMNIRKLIDLPKKFSEKIIFIGLTPVDDSKVDPIPWADEKSYKNEYVRKYNEIVKKVATEKKIFFVDIFEEWNNSDYKQFLEDGVHPNTEGHEKIFETIKDFLIKNKMI